MSGFLSNDGDILIDCSLTDAGRAMLARGDGSFKVTKYSLSDDEINYGEYDLTASGGSAYFDTNILLTPILESFPNNAISMKSKLISIPRNNILYLPTLALNTITNPYCASYGLTNTFVVCADEATEDEYGVTSGGAAVPGVLYGEELAKGATIRMDQGLDTTAISPKYHLDADLMETQYMIQMDRRFGEIASPASGNIAQVSYIDDDNVASYYLTTGDAEFVEKNSNINVSASEIIDGPRGTILRLRVKASIDLNSTTSLFTELGGTASWTGRTGAHNIYYLDSIIQVIGGTTGNFINIPVRFAKLQ